MEVCPLPTLYFILYTVLPRILPEKVYETSNNVTNAKHLPMLNRIRIPNFMHYSFNTDTIISNFRQ